MTAKNRIGKEEKRILAVEDEEDQRIRLKYVLESEGYGVDLAVNGEKAVEMIAEARYDLVITDLKMPGSVNGMDVLIAARNASETTEVILVTAYGSVDNAVQAMINGAFDYVQKPVNMPEFRIKVERALRQAELRQEAGSREVLRNNFNSILRELDCCREKMKSINALARMFMDDHEMKLERMLDIARSIIEASRS